MGGRQADTLPSLPDGTSRTVEDSFSALTIHIREEQSTLGGVVIVWPDRQTVSSPGHPCQVRDSQLGPRGSTLKLQIPEEAVMEGKRWQG